MRHGKNRLSLANRGAGGGLADLSLRKMTEIICGGEISLIKLYIFFDKQDILSYILYFYGIIASY